VTQKDSKTGIIHIDLRELSSPVKRGTVDKNTIGTTNEHPVGTYRRVKHIVVNPGGSSGIIKTLEVFTLPQMVNLR